MLVGVSKHLTREKTFLEELKSHSNSYVTIGDGAKIKIKGVGKLVSPCSLFLDDVILVEGSNANMISINQRYDQELNVNFNGFECVITNKDKEVIVKKVMYVEVFRGLQDLKGKNL